MRARVKVCGINSEAAFDAAIAAGADWVGFVLLRPRASSPPLAPQHFPPATKAARRASASSSIPPTKRSKPRSPPSRSISSSSTPGPPAPPRSAAASPARSGARSASPRAPISLTMPPAPTSSSKPRRPPRRRAGRQRPPLRLVASRALARPGALAPRRRARSRQRRRRHRGKWRQRGRCLLGRRKRAGRQGPRPDPRLHRSRPHSAPRIRPGWLKTSNPSRRATAMSVKPRFLGHAHRQRSSAPTSAARTGAPARAAFCTSSKRNPARHHDDPPASAPIPLPAASAPDQLVERIVPPDILARRDQPAPLHPEARPVHAVRLRVEALRPIERRHRRRHLLGRQAQLRLDPRDRAHHGLEALRPAEPQPAGPAIIRRRPTYPPARSGTRSIRTSTPCSSGTTAMLSIPPGVADHLLRKARSPRRNPRGSRRRRQHHRVGRAPIGDRDRALSGEPPLVGTERAVPPGERTPGLRCLFRHALRP